MLIPSSMRLDVLDKMHQTLGYYQMSRACEAIRVVARNLYTNSRPDQELSYVCKILQKLTGTIKSVAISRMTVANRSCRFLQV